MLLTLGLIVLLTHPPALASVVRLEAALGLVVAITRLVIVSS